MVPAFGEIRFLPKARTLKGQSGNPDFSGRVSGAYRAGALHKEKALQSLGLQGFLDGELCFGENEFTVYRMTTKKWKKR